MKLSTLIASAAVLSALSLQPVIAQQLSTAEIRTLPQVDYAGFLQLTEELSEYRQERLVDLKKFNAIAKDQNAIILDSRSAAAFAQGHIEGAINIPFSDFTEEKLTKLLGDKTRPILIYCNNNFRDDIPPIPLKRAPLALNIPTFINLYGYGYENIYELNGVTHMADPLARWTGIPRTLTINPSQLSQKPIEDATRAN
ncbi:rhodanese-like domain-containing protein [Parasphingorhabdus cellanae]|uniref:Rhodanese-like domain-containing protein n=1 Tax=Parasphingorhabdus cellanae TaxID=2806553 RepID=A0ABX7T238_9SPHN|nr:rhodanese-like domain-containing protein [Parasphingorhabdus cellanae]QTD55621.1 rhodanese-like domain-containing protein [Parasphingorhabdus cellanae]